MEFPTAHLSFFIGIRILAKRVSVGLERKVIMQSANNKMGSQPVTKMLFGMSMPIICSMMIQALYNVIDSMYVAHINGNALTAVSIVFPFQLLMIALATGSGVGIPIVVSSLLGKKDLVNAGKAAKNSLLLGCINFVVLGISGFFLADSFVSMQTTVSSIINDSASYMKIIGGASFGYFLSIVYERLLQSTGKTVFSMLMQLIGAVLNMILDPIMIFGLFGFPKLGVAGAAWATVSAQTVSLLLGLVFHRYANREIHCPLSGFKPDIRVIFRIYKLGFPSFFIQTVGSVTTFFINRILLQFTADAVAIYGICSKLQNFVFMPVYGLSNGMVPAFAYNLGADKNDRVKKIARVSITVVFCITLCGTVVCSLFAHPLLNLFDASDKMLQIGIHALRIFSLSFPFAGFCVISNSIFQASGKGFYSIILTIIRQFVILAPCAYFISKWFGINAVWWSFLLAELVTCIVTAHTKARHFHHKCTCPF